MVHTLSVVALILLAAGSSEASGRALLQQTLQGPYLPDVLAAQTNGWDCQGNTCQRRQMTYDDMWLFYHMFYEPAPPPPPPPSEKELVIKRVYGCHDDDDDPIYCGAIDRRIQAAMSSIDHLSQTSLVRRVPTLGLANPAPRFEDGTGFLSAEGIPDLVSQALQDVSSGAGRPVNGGMPISRQFMPQPQDFQVNPALPVQPQLPVPAAGAGPTQGNEGSMAIQISSVPGSEA
eukprot:CAMPEP_0117695706 /NCGR_PEP_ID=MMETSP0804-20121206/28289_1 /TAXON_ID=1074897 /ORGANISM="Tetraselmis astigmatica, Strain CCMP880" /LENGTH=231 /DNA_ID=CAMNT_0005509809 /DNA_START=410 /DNA_END=1105 /DNA_ORIENTATION=+